MLKSFFGKAFVLRYDMKWKLKSYRYELWLLGLTVLLLLVGLGFRWRSEPRSPQQRKARIEQNLKRALKRAEAGLSRYSDQLRRDNGYLNFSTLLETEAAFPTFIFRDGELAFWSDHKLDFSPENLKTRFREQPLKNRHGFFVVRSHSLSIQKQRYDLYALIPIQRNYRVENSYLSNTPNPRIFPNSDIRIHNDRSGRYSVQGPDGNLLFTLDFPASSPPVQRGTLWFLGAILLAAWLVVRLINRWLSARQYGAAALLSALTIFGLRGLAFWFDPAEDSSLADLFAPQYFAWSEWTPSLGDLLLNVSLLALMVAVWSRARLPERTRYWALQWRVVLATVLWLLSFVALYGQYRVLEALYLHSSISLDITQSLSWAWPRLVSWLVFLLFSACYFLLNILIWREVNRLFSPPEQRDVQPYLLLGGATLVLLLLNLGGLKWEPSPLSLFVLLHTLMAYAALRYETALRGVGFAAFLMLAASFLVQAGLGAYVIAAFEPYRQEQHKERFAEQLLQENDGFGEVLLHDAAQKIRRDPLIEQYLRFRNLTPEQVVTKKIRRFYLGSYFDKYETEIFLYDQRDNTLQDAPPYDSLYRQYARSELATAYPQLFFTTDRVRDSKQYFVFLENKAGKVVLRLTLKKYVPNSIYPNLLLDNAYMTPAVDEMSYAIFQNGDMIYHWGRFSYDRAFLQRLRRPGTAKNFTSDQYRHRHIQDGEREIIISTPEYGWQAWGSNFSFLFLLQVFFALPTLFVYRFLNRDGAFSLQLSTRIQLYLNLAFFLPLLLVSALIIGLLNRENAREIEQTYREKSELAARNLADELQTYFQQSDSLGRGAITPLAEQLTEVARLTGTEIHLFDTQGELIISNQPAIYDSYLLSERVNPSAVQHIIEQGQNFLLANEQIGELNYNAVYVDIESFESGRALGILGVPFFESGQRAERQIIDILTIILNVFTLIFILLLVASYILSARLTRPLELIRAKMQQVSLQEKNLPLSYQGDDEIGALVKEYNKMIYKLEESKQALARSEKESAWREMAKQVAHEIKNPLTPMKLTLQHLQRAMGSNGKTSSAPIRTLLTQIDTLSDIANSFSVFAKMPIPKEEVFDFGKVVRDTVALYENHDRAIVNSQLHPGKFLVRADAGLMGRILTNLILNGIQSVASDEVAKITVELSPVRKQQLRLSVRDNGCGIPEAHQHKIFMPSFTTKSSGSGIGLAVAKKGIEHAGGKIWFESEPEQGTTFFIELPLLSWQPATS